MGAVASYVKSKFGRNNFGRFVERKRKAKKKVKPAENLVVEDIVESQDAKPFTKLESEFDHEFEISSLGVQTGQAWISCWDSNIMNLMSNDGKIIQRARMPGHIQDICVAPKSGKLWICSVDDNSVRTVKGIRSSVLKFTTEHTPLCLCVTRQNNVLVGTKREVLQCSVQGDIENRTESAKEIVIWPRRIVECPVTNRVAVADSDYSGWGGEDKPHVTIMSEDLEVLWTFRGEKQYRGHQPRDPPDRFDPYDVCYDSQGNLLVANKTKRSVMLLDQDGYYIRNVIKETILPVAIGVQKDGLLWVGFGPISRKVKVYKYSVP